MKIRMKASMRTRTLTRKGIVLLAKKTKEAARAYEKAFLSPLIAHTAAGQIIMAEKIIPKSEAASATWEAGDVQTMVYKESLFLVAQEMTKTLAREKEYENFDAAQDTQDQLDEVMAQLREMGDQRDLFEEDDEEKVDPRQLDLAGVAAGGSDDDED
jgi:hypothetical protein